ncbi:MAG TPA: heme ABC exporter ATP-binding protein CcmA [Acidimicrobiales bacterium]|nr:heme ABC exporter ATP-binding protein CcmA [Acidimicrobiales bacterium]
MEPAVSFRSVVALLGGFPALAGLDLRVGSGEAVLLRGPNGAGKSTVLRVCAGLVPVLQGEAVVLGVDVSRDRRAVRRRVAMLGHAGFMYDDLTVAENVNFAVAAAGGDKAGVPAALARMGLDGRLASTRVGALSAGQRRRAALAPLVARRAELWLLDEPHAALDEAGRDLVDDIVRDALGSGATVLMASHDTERATALADRVCTVAGGIVTQSTEGPVRVP